jgi:superoxide dismutase, Cu-Zn family
MKKTLGLIGTTLALTAAGAFAVADEAPSRGGAAADDGGWDPKVGGVILHDTEGKRVGRVWLTQSRRFVHVRANLHSLPPGFHGFHIHTTGVCDPAAPEGPFTSAGGHYNPDASNHGEHAGDLPSVYVNDNGWARMSFFTDAFTVSELREGDGSAVMIHAGRDNYANIPTRYTSGGAPGPDADTLKTGDAGDRYACGVVSR